MLLGPVKLISLFAALVQGENSRFKYKVAILGAVIASTVCAVVALAGSALLGKYRISLVAALPSDEESRFHIMRRLLPLSLLRRRS